LDVALNSPDLKMPAAFAAKFIRDQYRLPPPGSNLCQGGLQMGAHRGNIRSCPDDGKQLQHCIIAPRSFQFEDSPH